MRSLILSLVTGAYLATCCTGTVIAIGATSQVDLWPAQELLLPDSEIGMSWVLLPTLSGSEVIGQHLPAPVDASIISADYVDSKSDALASISITVLVDVVHARGYLDSLGPWQILAGSRAAVAFRRVRVVRRPPARGLRADGEAGTGLGGATSGRR